MLTIYTDPDHPQYAPFYDPELLAEAAPLVLKLQGRSVRGLHMNGEVIWISIEDVENILGVDFVEPGSRPCLTVLSGGAK